MIQSNLSSYTTSLNIIKVYSQGSHHRTYMDLVRGHRDSMAEAASGKSVSVPTIRTPLLL